jgi:hypothetical protein
MDRDFLESVNPDPDSESGTGSRSGKAKGGHTEKGEKNIISKNLDILSLARDQDSLNPES